MQKHIEEYKKYFKSMKAIKIPSPLKLLSSLLILFLIVTALMLVFVPWVQTSFGTGTITALYPEDRVQTINALVSGRIGKWFVSDGQRVKKGDPIVEIQDNDPDYFARLESERDAIAARLQAAESAANTSSINYRRQKDLFKEGLSSKKDYEEALIKLEGHNATVEAAKADLNKAEVQLSRQHTQRIVAPQDGTVLQINAGDLATFIKTGAPLATFFPEKAKPAAELYINGLDAPLIYKGRDVQLIFEGWPAVQFSGWPSIAKGTFKGVVYSVDPAMSNNGKIRVLVVETKEDPWPSGYYLRFGARARGWIQLDTVQLGYELWRQMNSFPPEFSEKALQKAEEEFKIKK